MDCPMDGENTGDDQWRTLPIVRDTDHTPQSQVGVLKVKAAFLDLIEKQWGTLGLKPAVGLGFAQDAQTGELKVFELVLKATPAVPDDSVPVQAGSISAEKTYAEPQVMIGIDGGQIFLCRDCKITVCEGKGSVEYRKQSTGQVFLFRFDSPERVTDILADALGKLAEDPQIDFDITDANRVCHDIAEWLRRSKETKDSPQGKEKES